MIVYCSKSCVSLNNSYTIKDFGWNWGYEKFDVVVSLFCIRYIFVSKFTINLIILCFFSNNNTAPTAVEFTVLVGTLLPHQYLLTFKVA